MNIGPEFQAEIPDLLEQEQIDLWSEEPLREELLWKPWAELEGNDDLLEQGKYLNKEVLTLNYIENTFTLLIRPAKHKSSRTISLN